MDNIAILAALLAVVSLIRVRISSWPITAPMLFVGAGMLLSPDALGVLDIELEDESVELAAELTLALLLFSDAARLDVPTLRQSFSIPARLLGIGLPLTIALGTVVTALLLTDLSWVEAALVAAILAPTDAALGQAVVTNPAVPVRIRQSLNVESGLNDGLVVPVVAVFFELTSGDQLGSASSIVLNAIAAVVGGALIGAAVGALVGRLIQRIRDKGWTDLPSVRLVAVGGSLGTFAFAAVISTNGFIAAFVCGLALRQAMGPEAAEHTELAEDLGQVGASMTFILFGALLVWPALGALTFAVAVCAFATLTIGRMAPVGVSLIGAGLRLPTVGFIGWFGPRGLASMLFGLVIVTKMTESSEQLFSVVAIVILASVVLHGASAAKGAVVYSEWFDEHGHEEMAEAHSVVESRVRGQRK